MSALYKYDDNDLTIISHKINQIMLIIGSGSCHSQGFICHIIRCHFAETGLEYLTTSL